jgi:thymidylate kinase
MRGKFIVVEGSECVGKSSFTVAAKKWACNNQKQIMDLKEFAKANLRLPLPEELDGYDALVNYEPSSVWTGSAIREEFVKRSDRIYSGRETGEAFSVDRLVLYRRVIKPALEKELIVFSDRSVVSSIVYQPITEPDPIPVEELIKMSGQACALETKIDHLIIILADPKESMARINSRTEKIDDAVFEKEAFLKQIDERYRSEWLRKMFEDRGTQVHYIDTSGSTMEDTKQKMDSLLLSILKQ